MMIKRICIIFCLIGLGACSTSGGEYAQNRGEGHIYDPYEHTNRQLFAFNRDIDTLILEPLGEAYLSLPEGGQDAITNFGIWASHPSTAINSILQGKIENGLTAAAHFLVNALTLGFADLIDGDDPTPEDFGQTLAAWSAPAGPYIMMPFLGPGTTRQHIGTVVDSITNPLSWGSDDTINAIPPSGSGADVVSFRGNNFDQINDIKYNSADAYAQTRSIYYQFREGELKDGDESIPSAKDEAFDAFLEEEEENP